MGENTSEGSVDGQMSKKEEFGKRARTRRRRKTMRYKCILGCVGK